MVRLSEHMDRRDVPRPLQYGLRSLLIAVFFAAAVVWAGNWWLDSARRAVFESVCSSKLKSITIALLNYQRH